VVCVQEARLDLHAQTQLKPHEGIARAMPTTTETATLTDSSGTTTTTTTTTTIEEAVPPPPAAAAAAAPEAEYSEALRKGVQNGLLPEVAAVLHAMDDGSPTQFGIERARADVDAMCNEVVMGPTVPVGSVEEIVIPTDAPGDEGGRWKAGEIACTVYKPEGAEGSGPLGALVYFHGGGCESLASRPLRASCCWSVATAH
jgi:hypothetical protein